MERVNTKLVDDVKKLGAFDLDACYSCGNCSAICPLSEGEVSFPRKMIRYAMLGLEGKIVSSAEPWLCYYCGECSETCPREADPGDRLWGLSWRVRDADLARERLLASGLDVSEVRAGRRPGTRVLTVRDGTLGVPTLLLEPPPP